MIAIMLNSFPVSSDCTHLLINDRIKPNLHHDNSSIIPLETYTCHKLILNTKAYKPI
eukprot:07027.XXX_205433_205600_1 [CDS] Oithona nana genome sequencing.